MEERGPTRLPQFPLEIKNLFEQKSSWFGASCSARFSSQIVSILLMLVNKQGVWSDL